MTESRSIVSSVTRVLKPFSEDEEKAYWTFYNRESLMRVKSLGILVLVILFGVWISLCTTGKKEFLEIGEGLLYMLPMLFLCWSFLFIPAVERHLQEYLFALALLMCIVPYTFVQVAVPSLAKGYGYLIVILTLSGFLFLFQLRLFYVLLAAIVHLIVFCIAMIHCASFVMIEVVFQTVLLLYVFLFLFGGGYFLERFHRERFQGLLREAAQKKAIEEERERAEKLLLNILPASIAERLKQEHQVIADGFTDVSVIFSDIVGFTPMSEALTPEELVSVLNDLFTGFDRIAARHGLEKIKTIGDAYMVAAGVPEQAENHAELAAEMALGMKAFMEEFREQVDAPIDVRIGIHSGPVVAGVIGESKFAYDLWGDTVNTASRMESSGVPGKIHISSVTKELLMDSFSIEERGEISVKGKGSMTTYFLLEPLPEASLRS